MIYFKSKDISIKLGINLAKWKRWSRDFLPPDPLGGLQSGVARQFNLRDVFKIYFGGYLVGNLCFTIPEAVRILSDLSPWLKKNGFYELQAKTISARNGNGHHSYIYIHWYSNLHFAYCIRTVSHCAQAGLDSICQETFTQALIGTDADPLTAGQSPSATVIAISTLYDDLLKRIV